MAVDGQLDLPRCGARPRELICGARGPIGCASSTHQLGGDCVLPIPHSNNGQHEAPLAQGAAPATAWVPVFSGSWAMCHEFGLVLEAKGLPYELTGKDAGCALTTPPSQALLAREQLQRYAAERERDAAERAARRAAPNGAALFGGAGAGAIGYVVLLLGVAYCAGINLFGVDWLAAGAIDAHHGAVREWWRALTALTLHLDPEHLYGNLLFGVGAGVLCSRLFGPGIAWLSILAAGALGNYLELWIAPAGYLAAGASTAVFAALGMLCGYSWRLRLPSRERSIYRATPLLAGVALLVFLGAGKPHVDVLGHVLGFICGVVFGRIYGWAGMPRSRRRRDQLIAASAAILLVSAAWALALHRALN